MELQLALDRSRRAPLSLQIAHGIRDAIFAQRLSPGTRLPPTRELAQRLLVSRMVVVEAYEWLMAEGYVESRTGSGTFIAETLAWSQQPARRIQDPPRRTDLLAEKQVTVDFRPGLPALDLFPRKAWATALSRAMHDAKTGQLGYGPVEGLPRLRRVIAEYVARTRGLPIAPERAVITVGATQALDLMLRTLAPIDRIAIEDPSPESVHRLACLHHLRVDAIPVNEQGMRVDLIKTGRGAPPVVHVIPSHQYPTGWAMSLERRIELLNWAERHDAVVLEDDYDSEFRFDRSPPIALAALDAAQRVVYIGSFSKTLFPGLRLGFCIVPERMIGRLLDLKRFSDRCVPALEQLALAGWLESGLFERHTRRMRGVYAQRRSALLDALAEHFGQAVRVEGAPAGMHVLVNLDLGLGESELLARALQVGVKVNPVSPCCIHYEPDWASVIMGFGHLSNTDIARGVELLAQAWTKRGK